MFTLFRIYDTLTGRKTVKVKISQDLTTCSSSESGDDTDTDGDDESGGDCDLPHHSLRLSKRSDKYSRCDSDIAFDHTLQYRDDSLPKLSLEKSIPSNRDAEPLEPFPDIEPLILAIAVYETDDPPNVQGLSIDDVEIYLERLRDDPVFGTRHTCASNAISTTEDDTDEDLVQVLDTSVDFTSVFVSRSNCSTVSVKDSEHKEVAQTEPEKQPNELQDASPGPNEEPAALEDSFGPRHQLPNEKMQDYVRRVSARVQALLAKHGRGTRINNPSSSSAGTTSRHEDLSTSEESSFNDIDTCPSSPPTPFPPHTPLNHHNLSKLSIPNPICEIDDEDEPGSIDKPAPWSPPHITGPPIFNPTKTKMTPARSEVYKHIDFTPLPLFHRRSSTRRYVILEQDCLQCSLKNLPCDDYHPCCKRCQRSGDAPHCLRQRRLASWELRQLGLEMVRGYTVLIRLPEDGDEVWAEKLRREEYLLEGLQEKVDRGNWVLPVNDGVLGDFDEWVVRGKEVCEQRGGVWRYRSV